MSVAWAIFKKELFVFFLSPLAWVFLGVFLLLAGFFFTTGLAMTGEASLRVLHANLSVALLFLLPLLTMRHFAEERRAGTFELLMTAPVPLWALLLGKWCASLVLCLALLLLTLLFPAILAYYGEPDWGIVFTGYLGLLLACGAFISAGMFSSSLTEEPVAAGLIGVVLLLPFWVAGSLAELVESDAARGVLRHLSLLAQIEPFHRGVIDSAAVVWFLLLTFGFLFLTWRSIESRRWR